MFFYDKFCYEKFGWDPWGKMFIIVFKFSEEYIPSNNDGLRASIDSAPQRATPSDHPVTVKRRNLSQFAEDKLFHIQ